LDNENNGRIVLNILENGLEVRGDFFPPIGDGTPISLDYIRTLFSKSKITYGIQKEELNNAFKKCVDEQLIVQDVLIAKGHPPVNEVLEYTQLNPLLNYHHTDEQDDITVDHRARSPYTIVRKDQALAKQKSRKPGRAGKNVHGETLNYSVIRPDGVTGGENTRMEGRFLVSTISGQLVVTKGVVDVRDSLVIKGAVGYATGNIIFPGNVEIHGAVSDGFKIYSGGSVTIKQTFDVTDAVTKNDLHVVGGIIGRGQATVKVGGILKTKFIDNCRVACRKKINVDLEVINSRVYTLETLEMGDKGRIVGGEIYAFKGVRAGGIGKKTGKAARIHCGIDFALEQEREKNNSILKVRLGRLRELMGEPADEEKKAKMEALLQKLEEEQKKAMLKVSELLGVQNNYTDAMVLVSGEIVAGTLIEICQTALFVKEPLKKVKIRLDRENNKLVTEKL
jgi:hypothetical protein